MGTAGIREYIIAKKRARNAVDAHTHRTEAHTHTSLTPPTQKHKHTPELN